MGRHVHAFVKHPDDQNAVFLGHVDNEMALEAEDANCRRKFVSLGSLPGIFR